MESLNQYFQIRLINWLEAKSAAWTATKDASPDESPILKSL